MMKKMMVALGIITRNALTGPIGVSVDLTRRCTMDCVMCWWRSPLLKARPLLEEKEQDMDFELFKALIGDLKKLEVEMITLGGQGEPLLYPRLFEAMELVKAAGMKICLITSGAYFNKKNIKTIFDLGTDHIDVSIQAATRETFVKMHPSQKAELFDGIKESLILLSEFKSKHKIPLPKVNIITAICKFNFRETVRMIELAKETGAESAGFKRVDVTPETKDLLLTKAESEELKGLLDEAEKKAALLGIKNAIGRYRRYALQGLTTGDYTASFYADVPCYVGWRSARVLTDGSVIPCCGCLDFILGNISNSSFGAIWSSDIYGKFRGQSLHIRKNPELFKRCKCYSCADIVSNLAIYRRLHPIKARAFPYD